MQRKKDSSAEYSAENDNRINPFLTYENIMLLQINRCNEAYSNIMVNFAETVRILEFCSIPLMGTKKEYEKQEEKIGEMIEEKQEIYEELTKNEFLKQAKSGGFYADRCNKALLQKISRKNGAAMRNEIAEESYKILLDNGRIRKTFRSKTGSEPA